MCYCLDQIDLLYLLEQKEFHRVYKPGNMVLRRIDGIILELSLCTETSRKHREKSLLFNSKIQSRMHCLILYK